MIVSMIISILLMEIMDFEKDLNYELNKNEINQLVKFIFILIILMNLINQIL